MKQIFKNLKIKHKIILMPLIAAFTFFLVVFVTLFLNERNTALSLRIQTEYYPLLALSQKLEKDFATIQRGLQDAVATSDTAELVQTDTLSNKLLKRLENRNNCYSCKDETLAQLKVELNEYYLLARTVSLRMITHETSEDLVADLELMTAKYNRIKEILSSNTLRYKTKISNAFQLTHKNNQKSLIVIVTMTLIGMFLLGWISTVLTRSIIRPLNKVVNVANEVGAGNFEVVINITSTDEIGVLKDAFSTMIRKINHLIIEKDKAFNELLIAKDLQEKDARALEDLNRELVSEIEERIKVEQELNKHRYHLEDLVNERTTELTTSNKSLQQEIKERERAEKGLKIFTAKLERSNRDLQDFAYIASHDLQEPLRKVQAFGDRLKVKCSEDLSEQGRDYLERMQNAAKRMQSLITDLLTYSRVSTKTESFAPVNLAEITREVLSDLEVRIEELKGEVIMSDLPVIEADPTLMRQLLQNLIGNALKFHTKETPAITIQGELLNGHESTASLCRISVKDNGIGFDDKYSDRIFGVFQRLHGRNEYKGTGVGLAVCRKIAERHGGNITAKSKPGQGATFIVTIPVKQGDGARFEKHNKSK